MKKNRILAVALVVCLIAILAFGSLAYFTDSHTITNQFKTASSDDPDKLLFDVDLYESSVNPNNTGGNDYTNILPGQKLTKDPTVKNTGLYPQYVRLNITVSDATAWATACQRHGLGLEDIFNEFDATWDREEIKTNTTDDTMTYIYYLNKVLQPGETSTIFKSVTIPAKFDLADMSTLKEFTLTIVAEAIQSENTGSSALEAFTECWGK